jgi:thymidylate synthase
MQNYNERIRTILSTGKKRLDRTGVGTISRFGGEDEYHFFDGFPLYGNRRILLRWIFQELRWMLRGDSNIRWLQEQGVTIWDEWAVTAEMTEIMENFNVDMFSHDSIGLKKFGEDDDWPNPHACEFAEMRKWLADHNTNIEDYMIVRTGDVGKMYPSLWRNFNGVDQIKTTLESIRKFPYSRRHCVSAWDPKYLPIDGLSPEDNVFENRGALATCHHFFQFYVEDLTLTERLLVAVGDRHSRHFWCDKNARSMACYIAFDEDIQDDTKLTRLLDDMKIPSQGLSISFHMRSNDTILGAPYNIASYAMLLKMYCEILGMAPMKVVHQVGDAHIYLNHVDKIEEMLDRPVPPLPSLNFREDLPFGNYKDPVEFEWTDFVLEGYNPGPKMDFPIAK